MPSYTAAAMDPSSLRTIGFPAHAIAEAVRTGAVGPVEVVRQHLAHIAAVDGRIGAFQHVRAGAALAEAAALAARADLATLPLAGVPVAVKDNVPVAGEPMRAGSLGSTERPNAADHEVVRRLRAAGAVVIGLTRLVGWKPGHGVVPADIGRDAWFGMSENGVLATNATDAALVASVLAGRPALATPAAPGPLRLGFSSHSPVPGARTAAGVEAAVRELADALSGFGHRIEPLRIDAPPATALSVFAHWFAGTAADAQLLERPERMLPRSRTHAALGRLAQRIGAVRPQARERWRARLLEELGDCDLLLSPTTATTAVAAEGWAARRWLANRRAAIAFAPFTGAANFAALPAISVPAGRHADGSPIGAHFMGRPGSEGLLLALAAQVEQVRPWPRHAPPASGRVET